ncbi:hypothetical protein P170DRAFT_465066 [Aspergillus steynii IBT 23096]|uniref:Uncharacterized protein n=1 Tax=Aspergillus steynii IBT 23096 TaxID=1392250 RepID=A0A2I2GA38_9EURO|nr:uncharacterized protein P170DRAFT_465066 [Aspergillus steynii IBT 23096]PLB49740.1 hypothetical protein P170DRAFT_465066 [Aspergillus steynii IBT 23096]
MGSSESGSEKVNLAIDDLEKSLDHIGTCWLQRCLLWNRPFTRLVRPPSHLHDQLESYRLGLDIPPSSLIIIHPRVDAILLSIIGSVMEKYRARHGSLPEQLRRMRLEFNQQVTMSHSFDYEEHQYGFQVDDALWYGDRDNLETNLVVQRMEAMSDGKENTLTGALRGSEDSRQIYGIVTDSYKWHFMRVSPSGQLFLKSFDWNKKREQRLILDHLQRITKEANNLAYKVYGNSDLGSQSVTEATGCIVERSFGNKTGKDYLVSVSLGKSNIWPIKGMWLKDAEEAFNLRMEPEQVHLFEPTLVETSSIDHIISVWKMYNLATYKSWVFEQPARPLIELIFLTLISDPMINRCLYLQLGGTDCHIETSCLYRDRSITVHGSTDYSIRKKNDPHSVFPILVAGEWEDGLCPLVAYMAPG